MFQTVWAKVTEGRIELQEDVPLPEGASVLVTVVPPVDEESAFWLHASESTAAGIWDNPEDDVYAELLEG